MAPTHNRTFTAHDKTIAENVSKMWQRKKHSLDLNQEEMSALLGITQSAFSQMITGKMVITTEQLVKIAYVFEESPTLLDPRFYNRFDLNTNSKLKTFLAIELAKLSKKDRDDLFEKTYKKRGAG
jgi:plasmid maintenance system antidote protein VapI